MTIPPGKRAENIREQIRRDEYDSNSCESKALNRIAEAILVLAQAIAERPVSE